LVIEHQLKEKGIEFNLIQKEIDKIDEFEILSHQIPKKLATIKNKSKRQALITVKTYFVRNGYSNPIVSSILEKESHAYQGDEMKLLKKEYDKLYAHLSKKLSGYELKNSIKERLYQKGYKLEDIQKVLN